MTEEQKLYFFTGKGGVGKTIVSLYQALKLAQNENNRVLYAHLGESQLISKLTSTEENQQNFKDKNRHFKTDSMFKTFSMVEWTLDICLKEFVTHYFKSPKFVDKLFNAHFFSSFLKAAPALNELTLLGKATSGPREVGPPMPYDSVVIDSYSTGHFLSLLKIPHSMVEMKFLGPMGKQSEDIIEQIKKSHIGIVTKAEDIIIEETLELFLKLKTEFSIQPYIYFNQWIDLDLDKIKITSKIEQSIVEYLSEKKGLQLKYEQEFLAENININKIPMIYKKDDFEIVKSIYIQGLKLNA
jgi:hypothetical protein